MTRTEEREQAFFLVFEKAFNADISMDELIEYAKETDVLKDSVFSQSLAKTVYENLDAIDEIIDKHSIGWKKERLPKVTLSVLRLALCEILYVDSIPSSVSVNEAVELAKKYATESDAAFINGILGTYLRGLPENE